MKDMARLARSLSKHADTAAAIRHLRKAVSCESVTGNEAGFAAFLNERMATAEMCPQLDEFLPGRPNVWAERKGVGGGPRLLFMGHTDTVHVGGWRERWKGTEREDPFGGAIVDGALWGRGAADLKAGICASLEAVSLLDRAGVRLRGDIAFAFVGDEESGESGIGVSAGARDYAARVLAGTVPRPDFAIYTEPTGLSVCTAQMGFFIADVTVTGRTAYFGVPEKGVDALRAAHRALAAVWKHSDAIGGAPPHALVGKPFALVTEISGGGYIAVPGECRFSLIRKLNPGDSIDEAAARLEVALASALDPMEGIEFEITYPAGRDHDLGGTPAEIDPAMPAVGLLGDALSTALPGCGAVAGAPYWSESAFLVNQIGCPAVYCGPGDITHCHTVEERVEIAEYLACIVAFAAFIAGYCGTESA